MKTILFITAAFLFRIAATSQTLTLVTGQRVYDHHSSSLSGGHYGDYNVNTKSGYDFVHHVNVASGTASLASSRDMLENGGPFGTGASYSHYSFGFTNSVSTVGGYNYHGNGITRFYLNSNVSFDDLATVNDLVAAYDSTDAVSFDTVATETVYIARVRHSNMYVAMKITNVSNLTPAQLTMLANNQPFNADIFFQFDYKYGSVPQIYAGIKEEQAGEPLHLYPNPASGELFISNIRGSEHYKIISMTGTYIAEGATSSSIDIHELKPGIYFLELLNNNGSLQRCRFIKE